MSTQKGRRDHYLPQAYLRGFIDSARESDPQPLWKLEIGSKKWAERSTKQVGHITGLYDYAGARPEVERLPRTSMEARPPSDAFVKNRTISHMREEIQKGGTYLWELNWALRYTESVSEPFVTSEAPFLAEMPPGVSAGEALQHPVTLLYFPVCWQVCLFGSRPRFNLGTDKLASHDMRVFRRKYRLFAQDFLISPTKLDDITDFCGAQSQEDSVAMSATSATPLPSA